jgi:glutamate transport system permease protein
MSTSLLFDVPGPKTVLRHRIYAVLTALGVAAVVAYVLYKFYEEGQFEGQKWEPFVTPSYVEVLLVDGLLKTLQMAFTAIIGAVVFGLVFGVGKLSEHAWVRWPAALVVEFFRATPVLLLMVFIWYELGIGRASSSYWAVVIALTLYNGSVLAEVFRAGINAVPKGQSEAAYALGMRKTQVMSTILLPQAVKIMLPSIISQCIVALKDTALGLYVVAPGLTYVARQIYLEPQFNNRVPTMIVVAALYIVVNLLLTLLATWVQKKYVGEKNPIDATRAGNLDGGANTGGGI